MFQDAAENPSAKEKIKKVFVGGIGSLTEDKLQDFFSTFGTVTSTVIPQNQNKDSKDNKRRGFAFVTFDDYDVVDKVVGKFKHFPLIFPNILILLIVDYS